MSTESESLVNSGVAVTLKELIALRALARRLDLSPRRRVMATRSGGHLSRFRGRGMEFDESRIYQSGDDPRNMDWRVTARTGNPHVKLFREERERPVWLVVDQRAGMHFGTRVAFKSVIAARAAALMGWAAVDQGDRVGGLVLTDQGRFERRPAARTQGLLPVLEQLSRVRPDRSLSRYADASPAAHALAHMVRPGSLVILISDFQDLGPEASQWLAPLSLGNEVILIAVHDPLEEQAPPPGRYPVSDGKLFRWLDLTGARARADYQDYFAQRETLLRELARRHRAHLLHLRTDQLVGPALALGLGARPADVQRAQHGEERT